MKISTLIVLMITSSYFAQNRFSVNHSYGCNLNQKYNDLFETYLETNGKTNISNSTIFNFDYNIKLNTKHTLILSYSILKRKIRVKNWKTTWYNYATDKMDSNPVDFILIHRESGIGLGYEYLAVKKNKIEIKFGSHLNSYIISCLNNRITSLNSNFPQINYYFVNAPLGKYLIYLPLYWVDKKLSFSSILEINTKLMYAITPTKSLGIRVSLGASLHSNWDNFSNYVYLGLGAEYSFGKFKEKEILNPVK